MFFAILLFAGCGSTKSGIRKESKIEDSNSLKVSFKNIKYSKGMIYLSLFDSEDDFMTKTPKYNKMISVHGKNIIFEFKNLKKGTYAIICFQDLNGNKKLDFKGYMPTEPWGISNNPMLMAPPTWNDAAFDLEKDEEIEIKLF